MPNKQFFVIRNEDADTFDELSSLLDTIRLRSTRLHIAELTSPWGLENPRSEGMPYYEIARGSAVFEIAGVDAPIEANAGDIVLLPHGSAHKLRDTLTSPTELFSLPRNNNGNGVHVIRNCGTGVSATIATGIMLLDRGSSKALMRMLPPVLHVRGEDGNFPSWVHAITRMTLPEIDADILSPGRIALLQRTTEIFFIQIVRAHMAQLREGLNESANITRYPGISALLAKIQANPKADWSIAAMTSATNMSRSSFIAAFNAMVGESPVHYVMRLRLELAMKLLRMPGSSITAVADQIGYESQVAFSRIFKRQFGLTPAQYRRDQLLRP